MIYSCQLLTYLYLAIHVFDVYNLYCPLVIADDCPTISHYLGGCSSSCKWVYNQSIIVLGVVSQLVVLSTIVISTTSTAPQSSSHFKGFFPDKMELLRPRMHFFPGDSPLHSHRKWPYSFNGRYLRFRSIIRPWVNNIRALTPHQL